MQQSVHTRLLVVEMILVQYIFKHLIVIRGKLEHRFKQQQMKRGVHLLEEHIYLSIQLIIQLQLSMKE